MAREIAAPEKLWIAQYEFPLHFVLPDDEALVVNGFPSNGVTDIDEDNLAIHVSASLDARKTMEVVWHEITHAINWAYRLEERLGRARLTAAKREEIVAQVHGEAWSQFYLDNPKFVRWYSYLAKTIAAERA